MELINSDISEKSPERNTVPITLRQIAREVAEKYGLTLPLMRSNRRLGPISAARFEYYYRAATETVKSLSEIGNFIKGDHATVSYGMTRYAVHHDLPFPRGYRLKKPRKALVDRFYPIDLWNCEERTLRDVQRVQLELTAGRS